MQTSLQRRQRHRRNGAARRGRGGGGARRIAIAIPLLLFASFLVLGAVAFVGSVSAYAYYSRNLPDPKDLFQKLAFDQPSTVYDRTGTVVLAKLGSSQRALVEYKDIPPELLDATTSIEDKDFWKNPGFDLGGFVAATVDTLSGRPRGGSTITQQLVRARLLPPAAFMGSVYERKFREIIQSIRLTQAFPGDDGKRQIITAYLNQNFYGNQSYGVKAAAQGYFGKELKDLTLAQVALLAAIPKSPTQFDLVKNAVSECTVAPAADGTCPAGASRLLVPDTTEVVQRRNSILQLMETRSVLSHHSVAEYQAAIKEPAVITPPKAEPWKAAHFVWQVRHELGSILCGPDSADNCEKVDTGGYKITTTLDWTMQQIVEKWTYAAVVAPHAKDTKAVLQQLGIPQADWTWIVALKQRDIHNAAAAILDYRTGQILAYIGSAGYYLPGDAKFQPQFDVMSEGFRQPGSSIKPLNYITGIEDKTLTASTMFMDVVTDFASKGQKPFTPTQADKLERGPVRLRSALEFSLNIPSIKAGLINGLDHVLQREKDFGLEFQAGTTPVVSQSIGTLETHPIDLVSAYGAIANGGVLMPREMILDVTDGSGQTVYPTPGQKPVGKQVASPQASYIITDILNGNTQKSVNPFWAAWSIYDGKTRRPAAFKTGTTDDNKDVHAYGYLAPPADATAPALVAGVWMGNSDSSPNKGSLSLDSSAPLWSRILTEASKGTPIADFTRPAGLVDATVDAFSGLLPGPYTVATVKEVFIDGTVPTRQDDLHVQLDIDQATGKLWQDGCTGPKVTGGFLDFSKVESRFPTWQPFTQEWAARAAQGVGVAGGPMNTRTSYFYGNTFAPFGRTWGGAFAPTEVCAPVVPPTCPPPGVSPDPSAPNVPCVTPAPTDTPTPTVDHGKPTPTPLVSLPPLPVPSPSPPKKRVAKRRLSPA